MKVSTYSVNGVTSEQKQSVDDGFVEYRPSRFLRNGHLQTILARHIPRSAHAVNQGEQMLLFDGGKDVTGIGGERTVRLLGYFTPARSAGPGKGLVMLLHGWEGCSHSAYNLVLGSALIQAGFDVVRLNLRDHGPTHHLNPGIFYSTLIEEVHTATQQVALLAGDRPLFLIGASLGGSFVVRMALRHGRDPIPSLQRVVAINPAINPRRTSHLLDEHPLFRRYFRSRWLASLHKKQALFPDLYDFAPLDRIPTIRAMTDWVCRRYSPYPDVDTYLDAYAVTPADIEQLAAPLTILTAANDPIIPPQDFYDLPEHPLLHRQVFSFGGHVGYNDLFPLHSCLPDLVLPLLCETESLAM